MENGSDEGRKDLEHGAVDILDDTTILESERHDIPGIITEVRMIGLSNVFLMDFVLLTRGNGTHLKISNIISNISIPTVYIEED